MSKRIYSLIIGLILVAVLSGCAKEATEKEVHGEIMPELHAIIVGNPPEVGLDELYEQLDSLTTTELGCKVRFEFVPWGNEREQINIYAASGEYDFIPGGIFSDYKQLIEKNAFLDLKPYLEQVPELVEHYQYYSATALEECEMEGRLYGIPQFGDGDVLYDSEGFFYRDDLRKKWGLETVTDLASMEAYLYRAKEEQQYRDKPLITDNRIWQSLWIMLGGEHYIEVGSMQETPFIVYDIRNQGQVVNRLETEEFKQVLKYIRKWSKDGILQSDMLALSDNEGERGIRLMLQDDKPCETNIPIWSVNASGIRSLTAQNPSWEYDFFPYVTMRESYYMGNLVRASVVSISAKTKYPEIAIKFLEKVHTDQRYYDLLYYGVEGIHHKRVDEKISFEGISSSNRFCYSVVGDTVLGREEVSVNEQFYRAAIEEIDAWHEEKRVTFETSPLAAFSYNLTGLDQETKKLNEVKLMYFQPLVCGYHDEMEKNLENTIDKLCEAGLDSYIQNMNKQIEHYKNS